MIDPRRHRRRPRHRRQPCLQQRHPVLDHLPGAACSAPASAGRCTRRRTTTTTTRWPGSSSSPRAPVTSPLWQRGMRKRRGRAGSRPTPWPGRLPQVSWLVAPTAQSEHPDYFPAAGRRVHRAASSTRSPRTRTCGTRPLFILTYDENDGLFDHVPPPVAPAGTPGEYVGGEPIGLGFRVPGHRRLALVGGRPRLLRRPRPHLADPRHRAPVRRHRAEHQHLPPPHLRRLHQRLRFTAAGQLPAVAGAITLAAAEAGLLTAQQEVFAHPAPLVPATNEPVPRQ